MEEQFNIDQLRSFVESGIAQAQEIMADPAKIDELLGQLKEKAQGIIGDSASIEEFIGQLGEKAQGLPEGAVAALSNIPLMAEMVKGYVTQEYTDVSPKVIASLVSAFLYIVAPKDLVRDDIPLLGLVDDIAMVAIVMKACEAELAAFKQWREDNPEVQVEV